MMRAWAMIVFGRRVVVSRGRVQHLRREVGSEDKGQEATSSAVGRMNE